MTKRRKASAIATSSSWSAERTCRDALARLRALAEKRFYTIEPAMMRKRWRLTNGKTGQAAVNEHGGAAFTIKAAIKFLRAIKVDEC